MSEAGLSHQFPTSSLYSSEMELPPDFLEAPLVVHSCSPSYNKRIPDITKAKALSLWKIIGNFQPVINQVENMENMMLIELHDIGEKALNTDDSQSLAKALSSTGSVSLVLDGIKDVSLCTGLLENLSSSLLKLTMVHSTLSKRYQLPSVVNLQSLHVGGIPGVSGMFSSTSFPQLKRITITGLKWTRQDIRSLVSAVRERRLPVLKHLCVAFEDLSKKGGEILEITQKCELQTLDLMDTNLTKKDGLILLTQLEDGNLLSLQSLNILHNSGLNFLVPRFQAVATDQQIDIQCAERTDLDTTSWSFKFHLLYSGITNAMCTFFFFFFFLFLSLTFYVFY